jgi:Domain of unknown function (DUF4180)
VTSSESPDFRILTLDAEGALIATSENTSDLIGNAWSDGASLIVVPVGRLDPSFFDLKSGFAGEFTQKLVNYRLRVAVLGDLAAVVAAAGPFADWVWESNRGEQVWFVADAAELDRRLEERHLR